MPWYPQRKLAGGRIFKCEVCGRPRYVKYVPKSRVCRRCAAKKRGTQQKTIINVTDEISITREVEKRLEKMAFAEIPISEEERRNERRNEALWYGFWALVFIPPILIALYFDWWRFIPLIWIGIGGPLNLYVISHKLFDKPFEEKRKFVGIRVKELAKEVNND